MGVSASSTEAHQSSVEAKTEAVARVAMMFRLGEERNERQHVQQEEAEI
jgi:hypothetical protein